MKNIFLLFCITIFLTSCMSAKKCDCSKPLKESAAKGGEAEGVPPAPEVASTVSPADIETINKMLKAVDDYVFREKKDDFTSLCRDVRFDCSVNDKRFPANKKKIRRTLSPFVSGSKTGLQKSERVTVRYKFYP